MRLTGSVVFEQSPELTSSSEEVVVHNSTDDVMRGRLEAPARILGVNIPEAGSTSIISSIHGHQRYVETAYHSKIIEVSEGLVKIRFDVPCQQ